MEPYFIYTQWNQNYITINDWSKVNYSPLAFGNSFIEPGRCFIKLGCKKRTSFEMKENHWLEYIGKIEEWLICESKPNLESSEIKYYHAFIYVNSKTLLRMSKNGNGFADI